MLPGRTSHLSKLIGNTGEVGGRQISQGLINVHFVALLALYKFEDQVDRMISEAVSCNWQPKKKKSHVTCIICRQQLSAEVLLTQMRVVIKVPVVHMKSNKYKL